MQTLEKPAVLRLRSAAAADADTIHAMTLASYAEYSGTSAPSSVTQEHAEDLRAALASGATCALVAELDGRPAGSVRYRVDADGLYFFRLGVLPSARGRGVARAMITALEETARRDGARRLYCRVRMNVPRNVFLYESAGFVLIGQEIVRRGETDVPTGTMEKLLFPVPSAAVRIRK